MRESASGSVTHWLNGLAEGDAQAVQRLWERYFARLVGLAQAKIRRAGVTPAVEDGEDAALSAFHSFWRAATERRYPDLRDRNNLWRLLVTITANKIRDQLNRRAARKRHGGRLTIGSPAPGEPDPLENVVGPEPTPEFAVMVAEELKRRLESLDDARLRRVAELRLEGYTLEEIAEQLGRSRRTVDIYLRNIRSIWGEKPPDGAW